MFRQNPFAENDIKKAFISKINAAYDKYRGCVDKGNNKVCIRNIPIETFENITLQAESYNVKFNEFALFLISRVILENRNLKITGIKRMTKTPKKAKNPSSKVIMLPFNDELFKAFEDYKHQHNYESANSLCVEILKEYCLPVQKEIEEQINILANSPEMFYQEAIDALLANGELEERAVEILRNEDEYEKGSIFQQVYTEKYINKPLESFQAAIREWYVNEYIGEYPLCLPEELEQYKKEIIEDQKVICDLKRKIDNCELCTMDSNKASFEIDFREQEIAQKQEYINNPPIWHGIKYYEDLNSNPPKQKKDFNMPAFKKMLEQLKEISLTNEELEEIAKIAKGNKQIEIILKEYYLSSK